jgi:sugar lactone lactonase YvrE
MRTITLPTRIPTCCEFGGKNLEILYVTAARLRKAADPFAGALFAIDVGVGKGAGAAALSGLTECGGATSCRPDAPDT